MWVKGIECKNKSVGHGGHINNIFIQCAYLQLIIISIFALLSGEK